MFGSVREVIENSNVLCDLGHDVTIYTPEGIDLGWLPYKGRFRVMQYAESDGLDCLIFANIPEEPFFGIFERSDAKIKAFCMMGFSEQMLHTEPTEFLTRKHHYMVETYWGIADGEWQIDYMRNFSDNVGPSIGGINLKMFRRTLRDPKYDIIWTGDMRKRKGGIYVQKAIKGFSAITYFKKGLPQMAMSGYMNQASIFVDGHLHGGWCNPVAEAMASGVPVCCTDIPCTRDFAVNNETALVSEAEDVEGMRKNITRLLKDPYIGEYLAENAYERISKFDYEIIGRRLERAIIERL